MQNKTNILIVVDNLAVGDKLQRILADGYAVTLAVRPGEDIDKIISAENPQLVLVELSSETDFDGIDVGAKVHAGFNLPLIFIADRSDREMFDRSLVNEPFAYLLKPFDSASLNYAIEITLERHRFEENLKTSNNQYRGIFETSGAALMIVDNEGMIEMVNNEFVKMSGLSAEEVVGKTCWPELLIDSQPNKNQENARIMNSDLQIMPSEFQATLTGKSSRDKLVLAKIRKTPGSDRRIISIFDITKFKLTEDEILNLNMELRQCNDDLKREISEREQIEIQLKHQATHDFLTGLPNRELLFDRLHQSLAFEERHNNKLLALMIIDLDNFKIINDTLGHMCGDFLLKDAATRLQQCMRQYDTIARLGGDEFVVICNNMPDYESIVNFAEKVRSVFQFPFHLFDRQQNVTASIGIAISPFHGTTSDELLKKADRAMYEAKKKKNKNSICFFSHSLEAIDSRQIDVFSQLQAGMERDEFFPHYQPRMNTATGRITGMEALMRWKPDGAMMVHPTEFIAPLEESGLIIPVGERFIYKICRQNKSWQEAGIPPLRVAVKVSEKQFLLQNLSMVVKQALNETGLNPKYLELELAENIIMNNIAESALQLEQLKKVGVSISIDNFGTGYTSLSYLNKLPVDELKIDRSLINGIINNNGNAAIVAATIAMGHKIGKKIIAQGVESQKQLNFLSQQECEGVQGYLFYRPLPTNAFENVVREYFMSTPEGGGTEGTQTIN